MTGVEGSIRGDQAEHVLRLVVEGAIKDGFIVDAREPTLPPACKFMKKGVVVDLAMVSEWTRGKIEEYLKWSRE